MVRQLGEVLYRRLSIQRGRQTQCQLRALSVCKAANPITLSNCHHRQREKPPFGRSGHELLLSWSARTTPRTSAMSTFSFSSWPESSCPEPIGFIAKRLFHFVADFSMVAQAMPAGYEARRRYLTPLRPLDAIARIGRQTNDPSRKMRGNG